MSEEVLEQEIEYEKDCGRRDRKYQTNNPER